MNWCPLFRLHAIRNENAIKAILEDGKGASCDNNGQNQCESGKKDQLEEQEQQICPKRPLPSGFLDFENKELPNPLRQERRKRVLDAFQTVMLEFDSALSPLEQIFKPQGTHPFTGQALPPIFNNRERIATYADIANLSNNVAGPFAFQVINTTYNIAQDND